MKPVVVQTAAPLRAAALLLAAAVGCGQAPAEPAGHKSDSSRPPPSSVPAPGPSDADTPHVPAARALEWEIPAGWNVERTAERGSYRVKAQIAPVGDDKAPADFLARVLGRADGIDVDAELATFFRDFDGDVGARARREELVVGGVKVRVAEVAGDYKQPMGPPMGPRGKHAAYVIQRRWRGIVAVATTPQREVWLLRLVGPSDTVESARSAMHSLLRSLRVGAPADGPVGASTASPTITPPTDAAHER